MRAPSFWSLLFAAAALSTSCTSATTSVASPSSAKCGTNASNTPSSFAASGGVGSLTISADRDCTWTVAADADWVSLSTQSGQGAATISFTVSANPLTSPRSSFLHVGSTTVEISQSAAPPPPAPAPAPLPVPAPAPPPPINQSVTFTGKVSNLSGRCPSIAFAASGKSITTDLLTVFQHGNCGDVKNGVTISGSGTTSTGTSIKATVIDLKPGLLAPLSHSPSCSPPARRRAHKPSRVP